METIEVDEPEGERSIARSKASHLQHPPRSSSCARRPPPTSVATAARRLRYRDLCLVALVSTQTEPFPDNWIYLHDPGTRAGRVQNFGAWSHEMVEPGTTCLGVEYFCFEGDEIWEMPESEAVGWRRARSRGSGCIDPRTWSGAERCWSRGLSDVRRHYEDALTCCATYLERITNLHTVGRNGLHRYNNQDHSMWTAVSAPERARRHQPRRLVRQRRGRVPRGSRSARTRSRPPRPSRQAPRARALRGVQAARSRRELAGPGPRQPRSAGGPCGADTGDRATKAEVPVEEGEQVVG